MDSNVTRTRKLSLPTLIVIVSAVITVALFAAAVAIAYPYFHHEASDTEQITVDSAE